MKSPPVSFNPATSAKVSPLFLSYHTLGMNVSDYDSEWPILKILSGSMQSMTSTSFIIVLTYPLLYFFNGF